jgi:hypothetical protein
MSPLEGLRVHSFVSVTGSSSSRTRERRVEAPIGMLELSACAIRPMWPTACERECTPDGGGTVKVKDEMKIDFDVVTTDREAAARISGRVTRCLRASRADVAF